MHVRSSIALTSLLSLASALMPITSLAAFSDVSASANKTAIDALQEAGILDGYADGTFKPGQTINRAEFLKIALEARGTDLADKGGCFPDVDDEWFAKYVCAAKAEGIIGGYPDGTFKPEQEISFVEATKILTLAYDQTPAQTGGEWYEPYGRALESSNAIPTTINALDESITRGEMAEMMWRIDEQKTDQPSKGLLNVKYPNAKINFASDEVQKAQTCEDLRAFIEQSGEGGGYYLMDGAKSGGALPPSAMPMSNRAGEESAARNADDYSQTNVQVEGVDEGDIVKTDGTNIYLIQGMKIRILKANPANDLKELSVIDLTKENVSPTDMYIANGKLTIIGNRYDYRPYPLENEKIQADRMIWPPIYSSPKVDVRIYDVTNASLPKLDRTLSFDGNSISTRRIDDKLYLVMGQSMYIYYPMLRTENGAPSASDLAIPQYTDSKNGSASRTLARCQDVTILPRVPSPQYLTIAVVPLNSNEDISSDVIVGNGENVYASLDNLYVGSTKWEYVWDPVNPRSSEETIVHKFAFTDAGAEHRATGSVPGHALNQFSFDEHENNFRIATTSGNNWDQNSHTSNNLYILNSSMQQVGAIEDIAPGESIYSTRFMGDRLYMVTFEQIDPLFVIDTSDPRNPEILGKLKIPGYSNYLHPYDENHIIGFGKDAVASKTEGFAWYQGMKVALFNVSDVANPKEVDSIIIGDRGTDSPLLWNHKALMFDKARNLLAFPVQVAALTDEQKRGNDGSAYGSPVFQGAYVYTLTPSKGFELKGTVTHYEKDDFTKAGAYWYGDGRNIERMLRIGENLYSISTAEVQSYDLSDLDEVDSIEFPQDTGYPYPTPFGPADCPAC